MKEDYISRIAKKIRNKLIYFIHIELKKNSKKNNSLLINSKTQNELNNKYQKCSDYCVETIETYSSSSIMNNGMNNNNYFHVSLTYCSLNNNYHMLIDNKNIDQMIGENNIIGKYYKGNLVNIRTTINKKNFNFNENDNKLEKMIIGDKKFAHKRRVIYSSLEITKNILINDNENNDNNENKYLNNNHNVKINTNNDINKKIQTIFGNKKKIKSQSLVNIYTRKLKNYCSTLIILKKRKEANNSHKIKNAKNMELVSPAISERKKNCKNEKIYFKNEKEKPKINNAIYSNKENHSLKFQTDNHLKILKNPTKLKSQTKIGLNLFKIAKKKSFHTKNRAQSIHMSSEKKNRHKRPSSKKPSQKISSPKKNSSPKKLFPSMKPNHHKYISNIIHKNYKKKITESNVKKFIAGGIINKIKIFNANKINDSINYKHSNNVVREIKINSGINKKIERKSFKRANTGNYDYWEKSGK